MNSRFGVPRNSAFTLLEIVLAVAIGAFLVVTVYACVLETVTLTRRTGEGGDLEREGWALLDLLAEDLSGLPRFLIDSSAARFVGKLEDDLPRLDFVSSRDSLTTPSSVPSDLTEVGYRLIEREDRRGLFQLYRREDFFFDSQPLDGGTLTLVSERVTSLSLEYRTAGPNAGWTAEYSNLTTGAPPAAVRIRFTLVREGTDPQIPAEEKTFQTIVLTGF